ncbi:hypothetical protein B0H10DRAFT_1937738 [Mycena sp. CBHHK59/15]|nr:hypothetical protein B0H10DRAFT_1937738 [Mycena sp. CBHHK59/15]
MKAANAPPEPSFAEKYQQHILSLKVKDLPWTLHASLNVPKCVESRGCLICSTYIQHLEDTRTEFTKAANHEDKGKDKDKDKDKGPGEEEEEEEEEGNPMETLFDLQDLQGRFRTFSRRRANPAEEHEMSSSVCKKLLRPKIHRHKPNYLQAQGANCDNFLQQDKIIDLLFLVQAALTSCAQPLRINPPEQDQYAWLNMPNK